MSDDLRQEIARLHGETLALQSILFWLLFHTERKHPAPIAAAFDDAANQAEALAIQGKSHPDHAAKALKIIEDFRKSIVR